MYSIFPRTELHIFNLAAVINHFYDKNEFNVCRLLTNNILKLNLEASLYMLWFLTYNLRGCAAVVIQDTF